MPSRRLHRVAALLKGRIATIITQELRDPALGFVTVTDARVTGDLREATVFYTVYGDETERAGTTAALEKVRGLVRSEVGSQTGIKFAPTITFVEDAVAEGARHIDELLAQARAADEAVAVTASSATYAGEPDPYRRPAEDEVDDSAGGDEDDASR